jgi:hypothetical protein
MPMSEQQETTTPETIREQAAQALLHFALLVTEGTYSSMGSAGLYCKTEHGFMRAPYREGVVQEPRYLLLKLPSLVNDKENKPAQDKAISASRKNLQKIKRMIAPNARSDFELVEAPDGKLFISVAPLLEQPQEAFSRLCGMPRRKFVGLALNCLVGVGLLGDGLNRVSDKNRSTTERVAGGLEAGIGAYWLARAAGAESSVYLENKIMNMRNANPAIADLLPDRSPEHWQEFERAVRRQLDVPMPERQGQVSR